MFLDGKAHLLLEKLDRGEPVLGTMMLSTNPEMVEILAYVGFDYIFVDQMFTGVDWNVLANMVRAARGSNLAVFARVENDPWYGGEDVSVAARVSRALGVGADGVKINVYSLGEAKACVEAGTGWHRAPWVVRFEPAKFADYESDKTKQALIVPSVESHLGIKQAHEMCAIEGIRVFGIAMTDTSIMLGYPLQYEHPEVWKFIDGVAETAKARGVDLCGGTGYAFKTWDEIAGRVKRLHQHHVNMIFLQTSEYIFQLATTELLKRVKGALGY